MKKKNWIIGLGICVTVCVGLVATKSAACLWALLFLLGCYDYEEPKDKD